MLTRIAEETARKSGRQGRRGLRPGRTFKYSGTLFLS